MDEFDRVAVSNLAYARSPVQDRLMTALTRSAYLADRYAHIHLQAIEEYFKCANKNCLNEDVDCLWYKSKFIDLGVYHHWAEFYCPQCRTYTYIEHQRDSS